MGGSHSKDPPKTTENLLVSTRITDDVLRSLTYESDCEVEFLFGIYQKKGLGTRLSHNMVIMTYIIDTNAPDPPVASSSSSEHPSASFEMRSVLIELFYRSQSKICLLSCSRLLTGHRMEQYECLEYFITTANLNQIKVVAHQMMQAKPKYDFLFNNCRHFSSKLFRYLRDDPSSFKPSQPVSVINQYYQRFPPLYLEKTKRYGYVKFSDLIQWCPPIEDFDSVSALSNLPSASSSSSSFFSTSVEWSETSSKVSLAQSLSGIECHQIDKQDIKFGAVLSVEMPDQKPFHHFAVYLGSRVALLKHLKLRSSIYLREETLCRETWNAFIATLENSLAIEVHVDHNGHSVGIRDFNSQFYGLYSPPVYQVTAFKTENPEDDGRIPDDLSFDFLVPRILKLIGTTDYNSTSTCTCIAAQIFNIPIQNDPQTFLPIGARLLDKYLEVANPLEDIQPNAIWDAPLSEPLQVVTQDEP